VLDVLAQGRREVYNLRGPRRTGVGLYDAHPVPHCGAVHVNREIVDAATVLARANLDLVYLDARVNRLACHVCGVGVGGKPYVGSVVGGLISYDDVVRAGQRTHALGLQARVDDGTEGHAPSTLITTRPKSSATVSGARNRFM
jgi:hypothetical protein